MVRNEDKAKERFMSESVKSQWRTELKVLENDGKQVEEALRQSEEKYCKFFTFSPVGMALFDFEGKYLEVNEAYTEIVGIPRSILLSKTVTGFAEEKELEKILEDMSELFIKRVNGGVRELHIHDNDIVLKYVNTLLNDSEEKPIGIISVIQDITKLKGPTRLFQEGREHTERTAKKVLKPPIKPDTELIKTPVKRRSFNPFKVIPNNIERDMIYEIEDHNWRSPRLKGSLGRFLHKSFELDDFIYELKAETVWRRKFRGDEDER